MPLGFRRKNNQMNISPTTEYDNIWTPITTADQDMIDQIIAAARKELRLSGFDLPYIRFPFALHHEFYKTKISIDGKRAKHADIAFLLSTWLQKFDEDKRARLYAWQAVAGAIRQMDPKGSKQLSERLTQGLTPIRNGDAFLKWARSKTTPKKPEY